MKPWLWIGTAIALLGTGSTIRAAEEDHGGPPIVYQRRPVDPALGSPQPTTGTEIVVGAHDTLHNLAKRYNVSVGAILRANGYKRWRRLSPGQQLIIPPAKEQ